MNKYKTLLNDIRQYSLMQELLRLLDEFEDSIKPKTSIDPLSIMVPYKTSFKIDDLSVPHKKSFEFKIHNST